MLQVKDKSSGNPRGADELCHMNVYHVTVCSIQWFSLFQSCTKQNQQTSSITTSSKIGYLYAHTHWYLLDG